MERNDALRVFTKNSGFVMVDRKLQEVKWLRTEFKHDHKDEDFLLYTAQTTFQKPDGTTGVLDDYDMAFDSVEKYENGISAETSYKTLFTRKNDGDVIRDVIRGVKRSTNPEYWVFDKSCYAPVRYKLELEKFYFDYSDNRFHTDEFPKDCKIYDTKEEALSYNTYKVIEQDGTEYERDGVNKLIIHCLGDEAADDLKEAFFMCEIEEITEVPAEGIDGEEDWEDYENDSVTIDEFAYDEDEMWNSYDIPVYAIPRICQLILDPNNFLDYYEVPESHAINEYNRNLELNDKDIKNIDEFVADLHDVMPDGFTIDWDVESVGSPYFDPHPAFGLAMDCVKLRVYPNETDTRGNN